MPHFTKTHIFILPHAEEYRRLYDLSITDLLATLNTPDLSEGLATDRYTAEKNFTGHRVYLYYYLIYPLYAHDNEAYAIVDFIGYTEEKAATTHHRAPEQAPMKL